MENDTKKALQTPHQKLLGKVKNSGYNFDKNEFRKFQEFFSEEFKNVDLEAVKKQAWRTN